MAGIKAPKVKTPAQMKMEMAVDRARGAAPKPISFAEQIEEARKKAALERAAEDEAMSGKTVPQEVVSPEEREENFRNWMSGSRIRTDEGDPLKLYHITPRNFDTFKAGGFDPTMSGAATWLASDPTYQPAAHNVGGFEGKYKEGTSIMPVYSNARRPMMLDNENSLNWAQRAFANDSATFPHLVSKDTAKSLLESGYDSIIFADPHRRGDPTEYIMLEPERQLKSAIGNRGTFDPKETDITKAHGGVVHMKDGGDPDQIVDQAVMDQIRLELANQLTLKPTTDVNEQIANARRMADPARLSLDAGDAITSPEMYEQNKDLFTVNRKPASQAYTEFGVPMVDESGKPVAAPKTVYDLDMADVEKQLNAGIKPSWMSGKDFLNYQAERKGYVTDPKTLADMGQNALAALTNSTFLGGTLRALGAVDEAAQKVTGSSYGLDPTMGIIGKTGELHRVPRGLSTIKQGIVRDVGQFSNDFFNAQRGITQGYPTLGSVTADVAGKVAPIASKIDDAVRLGYESGRIPQIGLSIKDVTPRVLAPANEQGFYSPTEAAALNLQRKSGSGQAFLNDLLKQENVRPDEINAMGLDTWLKGKKDVTAAEVQDYIANNKIQLGEKTYKPDALRWDTDDDNNLVTENLTNPFKIVTEYGKTYVTNHRGSVLGYGDKTFPNKQAAQQFVEDIVRDEQLLTNSTKYGKYALPGGENYREVVIKLPQKTESGYVTPNGAFFTEAEMADPNVRRTAERVGVVKGKRPIGDEYASPHWDDPNVLAHLRMSDRVTDGKKTLLVDEVQSDWHQAGREKGYDIKPTPEELEKISQFEKKSASGNITMAERAEWAGLINKREGSIPDAPFKEDWYQLALKRAIKEAIDNGYDRVALPTGSRVNERFSLTNHVDEIIYGKNGDLHIYKDGNLIKNLGETKPEELGSIVGKEVAEKLLSSNPNKYGARAIGGLDLKVGGEGNRKYYDEVYPNYLKKFGKKYGASVGKTTVDADGVAEPLHYMEITPAMREAFKTGIHMKRGGKVSFANDIDAMRLELSKG